MLRVLLLACLLACGYGAVPRLIYPRLDGRISGCVPVNIEDFPYQLSFEYGGSHRCSASIISPNWVVTAGHCVDGASASNVRFRAGSSIGGSGGTLHSASQIILHPDYDYYTMDFDISVARVSVAFAYGSGVQPITLTSVEPPPGAPAVISGWETPSSGSSSLPSQLQAVEVNISSRAACNTAYASYGGITENMICAAVTGGGNNACPCDSGAPLVVDNLLVGIMSWGVGCAEAIYPGVYTNVATVKSFITEQTGVA